MIFEYVCDKCGTKYDANGRIGAPPETPMCTTCGNATRRLFSRPGITYHGSGFYSTDKVLSEPVKDTD